MMLRIAIAAYLLGLLVFYLRAAFDIPMWAWTYYLWDKSFGAGFVLWILIFKQGGRANRAIVAPLVVFSCIRFAWEIVSAASGITINNSFAVSILFSLVVSAIGFLCFRPNSRLVLFLSKYL